MSSKEKEIDWEELHDAILEAYGLMFGERRLPVWELPDSMLGVLLEPANRSYALGWLKPPYAYCFDAWRETYYVYREVESCWFHPCGDMQFARGDFDYVYQT